MRYDLVCTQSKKANQMKMYLKPAGMRCFPILSSFLVALFFLFPNSTVVAEIKKEHFLDNFCHAPSTDKKYQIENNKSARHAPNDLEMIYERGTLRVLLQKKNDICAISTMEKLLINQLILKMHQKFCLMASIALLRKLKIIFKIHNINN